MSGDLAIALAIFLASAVVVIYLGNQLAKYGDALATLTGWGRLFVDSILVALATSLPELSTNISAVRLDPPNPELALGNVMGANMVNMFTLAMGALFFGGKRFLQQVAPEQGNMILLAAIGGAYADRILGPGVDTSYWWGRFATDTTVYLSASTAGLFLATSLGLISQVMLANRFRGPGRS